MCKILGWQLAWSYPNIYAPNKGNNRSIYTQYNIKLSASLLFAIKHVKYE